MWGNYIRGILFAFLIKISDYEMTCLRCNSFDGNKQITVKYKGI